MAPQQAAKPESWFSWYQSWLLSFRQLLTNIRHGGRGGLRTNRYWIWKDRQQEAQASIWDDPRGYYFCNIVAVSPRAQGQGVGRMLFEAVTKEADRDGMKCYLESSKKEPNVKIYEKMGFEMKKEMVCRDGDDVCMVCDGFPRRFALLSSCPSLLGENPSSLLTREMTGTRRFIVWCVSQSQGNESCTQTSIGLLNALKSMDGFSSSSKYITSRTAYILTLPIVSNAYQVDCFQLIGALFPHFHIRDIYSSTLPTPQEQTICLDDSGQIVTDEPAKKENRKKQKQNRKIATLTTSN